MGGGRWLHGSPICPMWAMLRVQPGIACPTYSFRVSQCCPGNPAAWTLGSLGRTILNNHSIKASAKAGLLRRGPGEGNQACSHTHFCSTPASVLVPGPTGVPQCGGRRTQCPGAQLSFVSCCASGDGDWLLMWAGRLTSHQAQTWTLPISNLQLSALRNTPW